MAEDSEQREERSSDSNFKQLFARYSEIAFVLPAATFVGWFIGAELDKHLHTDWIYIVGLILGTIAGFSDLIRILLKESK
jgi:F0F1-type ATP synthase assembly protein I